MKTVYWSEEGDEAEEWPLCDGCYEEVVGEVLSCPVRSTRGALVPLAERGRACGTSVTSGEAAAGGTPRPGRVLFASFAVGRCRIRGVLPCCQ